jgi:FkbM family methyltransferase
MADRLRNYVPLWARAYRAYEHWVPAHRGKWRVLKALHNLGLRSNWPFVSRTHNGTRVVVAPREGLVPTGVAWTCFTAGVWEPHLENCLRRLLGPGDHALDIGANIGYLTGVMCQAVAPGGTVCAFEPVDDTYAKLVALKELNRFSSLRLFGIALGAEPGEAMIWFDDRCAGHASLYDRGSVAGAVKKPVRIRTVDEMVGAGEIPAPNLIKIDVEGSEMSVLLGARQTIAAARPAVIVEYNPETAVPAGWGALDLGRYFGEIGAYDHFLIDALGRSQPVDLAAIPLGDRGYVDLLFNCPGNA